MNDEPANPAERRQPVRDIGLIVIGSEILDGRRTDRHFLFCRDLLRSRGYGLRYTLILPDIPALIDEQLRWALAQPAPFFCCGGIGATPDDYTRGCAARAIGVPLAIHPDGRAILEERWGAGLTVERARLVEFPAGSALIPNPVNRVPGFSIGNGHFVPGFPEMAQPMITWALDTYYRPDSARARHTLLLPGAREGDLIAIMERLVEQFPELSFSSLPRFTETGTEVELSIAGPVARAGEGLAWLHEALTRSGFAFHAMP